MAASAILDFLNFKFVTVQTVKRVELLHCAKFRRYAQTVADIWRFFDLELAINNDIDISYIGSVTSLL